MKLTKAPRTLTLVERKAFRDAYRGKVLLDAADPNWSEGVSADRLRMGMIYGVCGCVLAQWSHHSLDYDMADYFDALVALGLVDDGASVYDSSQMPRHAHYGFNSGEYANKTEAGNLTCMNHLQRAWTYILRRLGR